MNSNTIKILIPFLLCSLVISVVANAAPSAPTVTGTVDGGQSISLSGTGFGTHANFGSGRGYLAATYKNFDDGLESQGWWWDDHGTDNSLYGLVSTNPRRIGHRYFSKWTDADHGELGTLSHTQSGSTGTYYVSFWFMIPANCQSGKPFRMYASDQYSFTMFTGGSDANLRGSGYTSSLNEVEYGTGGFTPNVWSHVEFYISGGTINAYKDNVFQWSRVNWYVDSPFDGHTIDMGNMIDDLSRGYGVAGSYNYDEVFVDYTYSHVEICNSSTWAARTHCEVQIPTAWDTTAITATINQGSFANGSTAYVYVVDSTNTVGPGTAITFGAGGGDTTAPTTTISTTNPSNISANTISISGTASDSVGVSGCKWRIGSAPDGSNGTALTGTTSWSGTASGFSSGSNALHVACYDVAGNYGDASITVNYTPPAASYTLPGVKISGGTVR